MPEFTFDLAELVGSFLVVAHDHGLFNAHVDQPRFHVRAGADFISHKFFNPGIFQGHYAAYDEKRNGDNRYRNLEIKRSG